MCRSRSIVAQSMSCSKFHRESYDLFNIFKIFLIHSFFQQLWWHISVELWVFYVCCCKTTTWAGLHLLSWDVNKSTKIGFYSCKNSFYVKTLWLLLQWMAKILKTLRRSADSLWNFEQDIKWATSERLRHKWSIKYVPWSLNSCRPTFIFINRIFFENDRNAYSVRHMYLDDFWK